jgi:hypothetical protein
MFQSCQTVCISLNHREVHSVHSKWVTMILMLRRRFDNPLLWTICRMWSRECYIITILFQSCQTVGISLNHREVHSVHSKWVTMILMLSRRYDNPLLWTICHMWSGECYRGQSVTCGVENVTASCLICFRVVKLFVSHKTTEKFIQFIQNESLWKLCSSDVMIIHCCGRSVTCEVENVTASCLCFRVVKLFVSH